MLSLRKQAWLYFPPPSAGARGVWPLLPACSTRTAGCMGVNGSVQIIGELPNDDAWALDFPQLKPAHAVPTPTVEKATPRPRRCVRSGRRGAVWVRTFGVRPAHLFLFLQPRVVAGSLHPGLSWRKKLPMRPQVQAELSKPAFGRAAQGGAEVLPRC